MRNKISLFIILMLYLLLTNSAWCQNNILDSILNASLKSCLLEIRNASDCVLETNTFPSGWNIPDWCRDAKVGFCDFYNNKVQREYMKTRNGIRTISLDLKILDNGEVVIKFILSTIKLKRKIRYQAFSDEYSYRWKYSENEGQWILVQ